MSTEVVYLQHCLVVTRLVPHEAAAVSARSVYTIQPSTTCHHLFSDAILDGIAVDPQSRLIFYTDAGNDQIVMMTMSTFVTKTVINSSLDRPRAIVVDTTDG